MKTLLALLVAAPLLPAQEQAGEAGLYDAPFFPGATHDPAVPTPDAILGHRHASRLSHHEEILRCFERWVATSPRVRVTPYALSHEGRALVQAVITTPENHARLDAIRADLGSLFDPRGLSDAAAERIVSESPACAWMGYSIHGDETSGADAAVAVGYHLAASTDPEVIDLLSKVVVVIDPVMNPDGRERIIGMVEQQVGSTPSLDWTSMTRGRWPYGRGNHYLFDMNRDWMAGTQPETRGRWRAVLGSHPQLFVDAHEMESLDNFLFYPQEEPINRFFPARHVEWQKRYAAGIADAFDAHGWAYYTREWADGWAPFYSDAWGSLIGATGMLYEQARTAGTPLRQASGRILTYREAVHHQATASMATLGVLAANREEALRSYLDAGRRSVAPDADGNGRAFVFVPDGRPGREAELLRVLLEQGVEVYRLDSPTSVANATDRFGTDSAELELPAGAWVVPARQPMHRAVRAFLEFDVRMDAESLLAERVDLEREGESRIYDLTAWSLPHALDLSSWWADAPSLEGATRLSDAPAVAGALAPLPDETPTAWVVDGRADASVAFALRAMEGGLRVHLGDEPFQLDGAEFARGSVVLRRDDNAGPPDELAAKVRAAAEESGASVVPVASGRSTGEGPDFGGGHFQLLARPRIAILSNSPVAPDTFGHLWWWLDTVLGAPIAILDVQAGGHDLRRYNVLIVPETWGGAADVLGELREELEAWVRGGGTLIACADAAAALTKGGLGLSQVVLRRDALEELDSYARQAERERAARAIEIDEALVWGDPTPTEEGEAESPAQAGEDEEEEPADEEEDEEVDPELDAWERRFSPYGVTLRGIADDRSWITAGCDEELALYFSGSNVFLSKEPVRAAVRLAEPDALRLGGLVWPEARGRIGSSAWLTVERVGDGQVVLFAAMPAFRGYHLGTGRLFSNAVVYGPGAGASQPVGW